MEFTSNADADLREVKGNLDEMRHTRWWFWDQDWRRDKNQTKTSHRNW